MSYTLEDDEVAVIIRPSPYTEGDWHGLVTTGISYDNDSTLPEEVLEDCIHVAMLCTTLLDLMNDDDELYERVMDHRFKLLKEQIARQEETAEVINFNEFTKTKGNA
jgi:hypothetical protein